MKLSDILHTGWTIGLASETVSNHRHNDYQPAVIAATPLHLQEGQVMPNFAPTCCTTINWVDLLLWQLKHSNKHQHVLATFNSTSLATVEHMTPQTTSATRTTDMPSKEMPSRTSYISAAVYAGKGTSLFASYHIPTEGLAGIDICGEKFGTWDFIN